MSKSGIITYTVTAELKAEEIFNPKTLAIQDVVNNAIQNGMNMLHSISKIKLPINTKQKVWIADMVNKIKILDTK